MKRKPNLYKLLITAMLLALGMVLPFLTGQIPTIGQAISPLHIPAFICGLTCGPFYGALLGFVLPLLRSLVFGMPPLVAVALPMAFELCVYGAMCGALYPLLCRLWKQRPRLLCMVVTLLLAMLAGRLVGGAAKAIVMGITGGTYSFTMFLAGYFTGTAIGALIHLVLVPIVVLALEAAKLSPLAKEKCCA